MKTPIIFTAFGTTSKALASYDSLMARLRPTFPNTPFFWSYSSRVVAKKLKEERGVEIKEVGEILTNLHSQGCTEAIVQSLHLFPGFEYHKVAREIARSEVSCKLGRPLFTSSVDYQEILEIILEDVPKDDETAVLIVGHGTDHPSWTSFHALANIASTMASNVYVGTVEKFPNTEHIAEEIAAAGYKNVLMIPLFMVAGLHYRRDMIGANNSWQTRLEEKGLIVSCLEDGLALRPKIEDVIIRHIQESTVI